MSYIIEYKNNITKLIIGDDDTVEFFGTDRKDTERLVNEYLQLPETKELIEKNKADRQKAFEDLVKNNEEKFETDNKELLEKMLNKDDKEEEVKTLTYAYGALRTDAINKMTEELFECFDTKHAGDIIAEDLAKIGKSVDKPDTQFGKYITDIELIFKTTNNPILDFGRPGIRTAFAIMDDQDHILATDIYPQAIRNKLFDGQQSITQLQERLNEIVQVFGNQAWKQRLAELAADKERRDRAQTLKQDATKHAVKRSEPREMNDKQIDAILEELENIGV